LRSSSGSSSSSDGADVEPVLGFVMAVPAGAAGEAVARRLEAVDTVKYVENDVCIRVTQGKQQQRAQHCVLPALYDGAGFDRDL
jgi:hypothetical protein